MSLKVMYKQAFFHFTLFLFSIGKLILTGW